MCSIFIYKGYDYMDEQTIRIKRITLFILEILFIYNIDFPSQIFAKYFNEFIYSCYKDNKKRFSLLYNNELLEMFINNNWEILSYEQMVQLLQPYNSLDKYVELIEEVGYEVDSQINILVELFIKYHMSILELQYANPYEYYPKGFPKILQ